MLYLQRGEKGMKRRRGLLSVKDVQYRYGISAYNVRFWVNSGALKSVSVGCNKAKRPTLMFRPEDIEEFERKTGRDKR